MPFTDGATPIDVVRQSAQRRQRHRARLRPAARAGSATRASCCSARRRTARTSSIASARAITRRLIEREAASPRSRSRPTGPTPTASTATCAARATTPTPSDALAGFQRFPTWMWRNTDVRRLRRLAARAQRRRRPRQRARSASTASTSTACTPRCEAVLAYLDKVDPEAARRARDRYACFEHFGEDPQAYGYAAALRPRPSRARTRWSSSSSSCSGAPREYAQRDGRSREDELLLRRAERAAGQERRGVLPHDVPRPRLVVEPARPPHGRDARRARRPPRRAGGEPPKVVVWAHNSHLGDARATEMGERRRAERRPARARAPRRRRGPASASPRYTGTVTAASDWDGPAERKRVRPGARRAATRRSSTTSALPRFLLDLRDDEAAADAPARAAAGARHRRDLPPGDRAPEPLLPRAPARPVRRA